jgi:hypothetical protein
MSKHTELIERLRYFDRLACNDAIGVIEAQALEIEALRKDAERWQFIESAPGAITLRLHNLRPDQRAQYIDAAKGANHGIPPTT